MPQFTSLLTGAGLDAAGARRVQYEAPTGSFSSMGIVNKRNAVLGWGVWQVGKVAAKRKAKQALEPDKGRSKGAILSALAAAGGALWFWRRRRGSSEEPG